jgi:hypothetical protein
MVRLAVLIAMMFVVRLRIGRIDGRLDITAGNCTIDKVSKRGGSNGPYGAGS